MKLKKKLRDIQNDVNLVAYDVACIMVLTFEKLYKTIGILFSVNDIVEKTDCTCIGRHQHDFVLFSVEGRMCMSCNYIKLKITQDEDLDGATRGSDTKERQTVSA